MIALSVLSLALPPTRRSHGSKAAPPLVAKTVVSFAILAKACATFRILAALAALGAGPLTIGGGFPVQAFVQNGAG